MSVIVHISGYPLAELAELSSVVDQKGTAVDGKCKDWSEVSWGDPGRGQLGRIPMGLWAARSFAASKIVWSTGSTRIAGGLFESEYMLETAKRSFHDLKEDFPHRFKGPDWKSEPNFLSWLRKVSVVDIESTNTRTSMERLAKLVFNTSGISSCIVVLVSSANHVSRVHRDAMRAFKCGTPLWSLQSSTVLMALSSETCYGRKTVLDTVIRDLGD